VSDDVIYVEGGLLLVRPGEQTCSWAARWQAFLDAERARGLRPSRGDLVMGEALRRLAAASGSASAVRSAEAELPVGSGMLVGDEMSTTEAGEMLNLSPRQIWNLCEQKRLRSRKPAGRLLIARESVLEELLRREQRGGVE
jgi:hypothetical protein